MTLENRITQLEAKLIPAIPLRTIIFLSWATPNDCRRLQRGDRVWQRLDDESEDALKARAIGDLDRDRSLTLLFVG